MRAAFKISPLFFIMAAVMVFFGNAVECIVYVTAVVFHELAHSEVARRYGYALSGIKLMPYGASLTGSFEAIRPSDEIKIALAGPALNMVISTACVAVWWLAPSSYFFTEAIVFCNVALAVFNLLPIFPLDGGRIAMAFLSQRYPRQRVYKRLRLAGCVAGIAFSALFIASVFVTPNPTLGVIALFIIVSTVIPDNANKYQRAYGMAFISERLKKGLPVRKLMIDSQRTLLDLTRLLNTNYFTVFLVIAPDFSVKKKITETDLEKFTLKYGFSKKISELI